MSRSTATRVVVVEVAAEALLVAVAGDAHDERVGVLPVGEERQAGRLAAQLVLGVVQVGEVLDLGDRHEPGHPGAERQAEDRLLVEQRVEHPPAPALRCSPRVTPYTPPLAPTSSPNTSTRSSATSRSPSVRLIDSASVSGPSSSGRRPKNAAALGVAGARRWPGRRRRAGRRGDSGATTSAAVRQRRALGQLDRPAPARRRARSGSARRRSAGVADAVLDEHAGPSPAAGRGPARPGSPPPCGTPTRRRCRRARRSARCAGAGRPGGRSSRTHSARSSATSNTPTGSVPSTRS